MRNTAKITTAKTAAKPTVAKPTAPTGRVAKRSPAKGSAAAKPGRRSAVTTVKATPTRVPRQRSAAPAKPAPGVAVQPVATPAPVITPVPVAPAPAPRPRRSRPLIKSVRRNDGRALSYSERLSEAMHTRLKHKGPVCHNCRTNASRLASLTSAPSPLAI